MKVNTTSFVRYYDKNKYLVNVTMSEMEKLITDKNNKDKIAELIYQRYYERYLKLFFYESDNTDTYYNEKGKEPKNAIIFNKEYKNGFLMMASSCLLIETLSAFLEGDDQTPRGQGRHSFESFFHKANEYKNELHTFNNSNFYSNIRCGILHQGETYNGFKIRRTGDLHSQTDNAINATKFVELLDLFLQSYVDELKTSRWDSSIWDNCRIKLRHIIQNSVSE
ncbi:MAG TPA: hypothetical protein PKW76_16295 [bacterium]|nr:hypothetical protein [bacterium]HPM99710.1 hypothetical protein [bacterium]